MVRISMDFTKLTEELATFFSEERRKQPASIFEIINDNTRSFTWWFIKFDHEVEMAKKGDSNALKVLELAINLKEKLNKTESSEDDLIMNFQKFKIDSEKINIEKL